jgi:hypothetical protein
VRTAEGAIKVAVPQVRGTGEPFRSSLMGFLDGNSEVLERLVCEMYARELSTQDVEDAFRDATGELLISKSAVSEITDRLWEDYQQFVARDLSDISVEYLFVDAIFESLRRHGAKEPYWSPGAPPATGASTCCTLPWPTRSPRPAGQSFSQHAGSRHATAHDRDLRRSTRADQSHHGVFPGQHPDPVLVSPAGQPARQAARRNRR